jgi:hypothetical protein
MSINTSGLLDPQIGHVHKLVNSVRTNGFAVDMSETGTGKTYAASAVIRELNLPFAVICPKTVIHQWKKILETFGLKNGVVINYERLIRGNTSYLKWQKTSDPVQPWNESATREMPVIKFDPSTFILFDEGHKCKGVETSSAWLMIAAKLQGYKTMVSSATLATTPLEMKAFGFICGLHSLYNFKDFCRTHGAEWSGRWGVMKFDGTDDKSKRIMSDLNKYLFDQKQCASRMKVSDFGNLFPESHIVAEAYDLGSNSASIQSVYDTMEYELARLDERSASYREHVFAVMIEARRRAELCKVPLFIEMVEDLYDEGKSVVLFLNFTDTAEAISDRLRQNSKFNDQIGFIVGGQSISERQSDIEMFNADKKRVMIANISAGGTGVSLHDLNGKYPRASVISPTWSAYNMRQALGRVWRQGGLTKSYQRIVYAANCIEEQICRKVQSRLNCLDTLNDGDLAEHISVV